MKGLIIVDDEEGIRRALHRALRKEGYRIFPAENGEQAIQIAKENIENIAIVISDYKMPGIDGLETLIAIGELNPEITRILLTGYASLESAIKATNEGIDGFLTKPFDNNELRLKIKEYFLKKRLQQFVSKQILDEIQKDPKKVEPAKKRITVIFSDIRGFTALTQKIPPELLANILNKYYFTPLGKIIFKYNGTLDKHIGDSIMAIFGAPVSYGDDATRAVRAAFDMKNLIVKLNSELKENPEIKKFLTDNTTVFPVGFGISTGEAVTGIFGSLMKKEYTAIGEVVNKASRLTSIAKENEILLCKDTYDIVKHQVQVKNFGLIELKGINKPVEVFNLISIS